MAATAVSASAVPLTDAEHVERENAVSSHVFPFLRLPRELRDQIYDYTFAAQEFSADRAIERRHLKYFKPSAAAILLITRHQYFLLNRQVAREALEILFKNHTVYLSCGPFVLKALLEKIEEPNGPGRQWLKWLKKIELDWENLPNLQHYPPDREEGRDVWYWEHDQEEVNVDYIRGAYYSGHYDEYDHEGTSYDDNMYDASNTSLYPSFRQQPPTTTQHQPANADTNDPFNFSTHYPFTDPTLDPVREASAADIATKLDLLVSMEVTPLFTYLASPTFTLSSITLPLRFISRGSHQSRSVSRPGFALPLKIRYWVQVCVHALLTLVSPHTSGDTRTSSSTTTPLQEVRVKYAPVDIWASMEPTDDLRRIVDEGVWFDSPAQGQEVEREGEGEAWRAVWEGMRARTLYEEREKLGRRWGLKAEITFDPWDGDMDKGRVGDEVEIVFSRRGEGDDVL